MGRARGAYPLGVLAVLGVVLGAVLVGVSPGAEPATGRGSDVSRLLAEDPMAPVYREALGDSSVDFPRGVRLPERVALPPGTTRSDAAAAAARGPGPVDAAGVWRCAWQVELLGAVEDSDEPRVRGAARELQGFYALAAVERHVQDPGGRWYADVVAPAAEGDVEALREDLDLSCHPDFRAG